MIVAADHLGDPHVHVVDDDREVIGREAVGPEDDEVLEAAVVEADLTMNGIEEGGAALRRNAEAHGAGRGCGFTGSHLRSAQRQARLVVLLRAEPGGSALVRALAGPGARVSAAVVVVGVSAVDQLRGDGAIAVLPLRLEVRRMRSADLRAFVPGQSQPAHAVEDALHHLVGRPLHVGVLDTQDERPAGAPREQPVEESGAGAADVEVAGG